MTKRLPCASAPGPLEAYAGQFDDRLGTLAQRRGFREYLQGLLLPRDRHKTLTGLVGTEPVVGAQAPSVQRLQFFLSESPWDAEAVNARRLELTFAEPAMTPHEAGVRADLLPAARQAVHPGRAAAEGQGRSGLPHEAPACRGAGRRGA